jgi:hypothetical protein
MAHFDARCPAKVLTLCCHGNQKSKLSAIGAAVRAASAAGAAASAAALHADSLDNAVAELGS